MNRSLLIVADDPDELDILTHSFIQAGYEVISVHHPRQALEAASFRQFQVAIVAVNLLTMGEAELLQCLKWTQHRLKCIVLSRHEYPARWANIEGAFAWLVKPCNMALLEATVEDAFDRAVEEVLV